MINLFRYIMLLTLFLLFSFLAWNFFGVLFLINIIILFYVIDIIQDKSLAKKNIYIFPFFLCLNIGATFWLYKSDPIYSVITFIANACLMTFFFSIAMLSVWRNKKVAFILIWIISEWILTKWDLSWPWLTFGNVLGNQWYLIQWYSVTGVYGGSLWLLFFGLMIYMAVIKGFSKLINIKLFFCSLIPMSSLLFYFMPLPDIKKSETIVLYTPDEQSMKDDNYNKTKKMFSLLAENRISENSKIITPELFFLIQPYDLTHGNMYYLFTNYLSTNNMIFIFGSEIKNDSINKFNGITVIDKSNVLFRIKKKYVPVTEYTPKILTPFFGKSFYVKNRDDNSNEIIEKLNSFPFVCYEILFSEFVARKVYNTNLIMLLASEEFMNDSFFGSRQYDNLVRIRAIENSRYLIKNSYLGKSLIITPKGNHINLKEPYLSVFRIPVFNENTIYQRLVFSIKSLFE
ncbi:hypothetical protein CMU00_15945 [Elizabethkingia anophelis]|nr:hypothetical protein [Elizabethkingia anophelis]